jgi:hypothetical protein
MRGDAGKLLTESSRPPSPRPGFETELIGRVRGLVDSLPPGIACLRIGRVPGHPEWPEPYFEVKPSNPDAALFEGIGVAGDLSLIVGKAEREFVGFARGGTVIAGATWQQELGWIWEAVIAGGFAQLQYLDTRGRVIGCFTKLAVNGEDLVFRNGRRSERLFGRTKVRSVTYRPYQRG